MTRLLLMLWSIWLVASTSAMPPAVEAFGWWDDPPDVKICSTYYGGVEEVEAAVRKIRRYGGRVGSVATSAECTPAAAEHIVNEIWLLGYDEEVLRLAGPGTAGITFSQQNPHTGQIRAALVFTDLNFGTAVLEHELLHAMGLDHSPLAGHIMCASLQCGGDSWEGVRRAFRDQRKKAPAPKMARGLVYLLPARQD